jgi:hypothetical protein
VDRKSTGAKPFRSRSIPLRCSPHLRCWRSNRALLQAEDIVSLRRNVAAHASPRLCVTQRTESVALLIRSSALSDVGRHLHSQNELSIRLSLSSRLATYFSALAPAQRAGAQRLSAMAPLRHADCLRGCPLPGEDRKLATRGVKTARLTQQRHRLCTCGNGFDAGFSPYQSTRLTR